MEQHLVDLPLSLAVYQILCGRQISAEQLQLVDEEMFNSQQQVSRMSDNELEQMELCFDQMALYAPHVQADTAVTVQNVSHYLSLQKSHVLRGGVHRQFEALRAGVNECFPVERLALFTAHELQHLLEGDGKMDPLAWTIEELSKVIEAKSDGRQDDSAHSDPLYLALLGYLSQAAEQERRAFLKFCTSSPQLPVGGLKQLKLKVLSGWKPQWAKEASQTIDFDSVPPTTSTCEKILRLPPYSSGEVLVQWLKGSTANEHAQYFKDNA